MISGSESLPLVQGSNELRDSNGIYCHYGSTKPVPSSHCNIHHYNGPAAKSARALLRNSKISSLGNSFRSLSLHVSNLVASHTGTIGYLGSISIAVNSLTGPAMLNLPATFDRSGIIPTTLALMFVCILSSFCCLHIANTISKLPGNVRQSSEKKNGRNEDTRLEFVRDIEYSSAFQELASNALIGRRWLVATQVLFFACVTCLNISSIVDTSQVIDTFFGHWAPSGAVACRIRSDLFIDVVRWDYSYCTASDTNAGTCTPFRTYHNQTIETANAESILISTGDFVTTSIFLPLALLDLKESCFAQVVAFLALLGTSVQFVSQFLSSDKLSLDNVSWLGTSWKDCLGVVLFNFALLLAIPAWLYEKEPHVHVPTVVHLSSALALLLYLLVGILASMTVPNVCDNMLESMMSGSMGTAMQIGASIFAFAIIGFGIPLFSVLTRLNLMGSGTISRSVGNVLSVFLPFSVAVVIDSGYTVAKILSWGGIIFTGMVVFILPLLLAIHAVKTLPTEGYIDVYFGRWRNPTAHLRSLYVLLSVTTLAITVAIKGLFSQPQDIDANLVN